MFRPVPLLRMEGNGTGQMRDYNYTRLINLTSFGRPVSLIETV
jgi:hypothetical protein